MWQWLTWKQSLKLTLHSYINSLCNINFQSSFILIGIYFKFPAMVLLRQFHDKTNFMTQLA